MALSNFITLYNGTLASAATVYTPGASVGNFGKGYETLQEAWCNFYATLFADYTAGTSLDVSLEHSPDGTNWITNIAAFSQVTTSDSTQGLAVLSATVPNLLPFVRAKLVTVGGSVDYDVDLRLWYENVK